MDLEIRQFSSRAARPTVGDDNKLSGRAAPFNSWTLIGAKEWGFREKINPKAFNKTLNDGDIVLLDNHINSRPLARMSAGTLELHPGSKGLDWRASAVDTTYADDVVKNVKAGNYGGCSFSFEVVRDTWTEDTADGIPERELLEVNCREVSIVTFPAYTDTSVAARSQVDLAMEFRSRYWSEVMEGEDRAGNPKPYGDVKYADPKNGKYPIDTKEHCKAAWSYINMPKNAAKYPLNGVTLSEVKGRIKAACKHFGIQISDEKNEAGFEGEERTYEFDGFTLTTVKAFDDHAWNEAKRLFEWFTQDFRSNAEGEPGDPTRELTREERSHLDSAAKAAMKAYAESMRAEQLSAWGK